MTQVMYMVVGVGGGGAEAEKLLTFFVHDISTQ